MGVASPDKCDGDRLRGGGEKLLSTEFVRGVRFAGEDEALLSFSSIKVSFELGREGALVPFVILSTFAP